MNIRVLPLALATAMLLAGCALKKPPEQPELQRQALPGTATQAAWQAHGAVAGAVADGWLARFADPRLDALVAEAIAHNPDLQVAAARVEQAAAYVDAAGATLYPQVSAIGNISGKNSSSGTLDFGGVFASWELDLWGRVRAGREAAREQLLSAQLSEYYAQQSLAAMVARAWFLATEARQQKALADAMVDGATSLAGLARDRLRVGIGNDYDVSVAEASLAGYRDVAEQLDLAFRQSVQALETLVGRYPATELEVAATLPALPGPVPAGLPSELLERRPDVVAAERRVAAAFFRAQEAKAARLPSISLTGSFSSMSSDLVVLKERDDPVWGLGGRATVPLYLGGALQAQVAVRTAEQKQAVAEYGRAGANAFADVEKALSAGYALGNRRPLLEQAVAENQRALNLAQVRYRVGSEDLRAVDQQQLKLYGAKSALLRVQAEELVQRVNLHLALGGNFSSGS
ncbi:MAG: efflux transporter outer membrane subunit [Proteobacteria bacterium]|nr:MAG: efflux transporter outer membrane subunit [Pseudomonadota bacterium]MCL4778174.1 efflux transporter outer membrane subunit [Gammaproteobacteria bacterium]